MVINIFKKFKIKNEQLSGFLDDKAFCFGDQVTSADATFYADLGMRTVLVRDQMAILELRGGTHLILRGGPVSGGRLPFDLMVDDVDAVFAAAVDAGATAQNGLQAN